MTTGEEPEEAPLVPHLGEVEVSALQDVPWLGHVQSSHSAGSADAPDTRKNLDDQACPVAERSIYRQQPNIVQSGA